MSRTERRPVEDFEAVFQAIAHQAPGSVILVGGHAVNVWALTYVDRIGDQLRPHRPLTSADMDLVATRNALIALHKELGGTLHLSQSREITHGTLVLGVEPDTREIDVLRSLNGVPRIETQDTVTLAVCGHPVPVLFPHLLLQGKLKNARHLDQGGRQDDKHVKIMLLVLREFLTDVVSSASPENERPALALLQHALGVVISEDAHEFVRRHKDVLPTDALPVKLIVSSPLKKLSAFGQQELPRILASS